MTNEEKVQGLRDMADLLEREPELCKATTGTYLYVFSRDPQTFARLALALGPSRKSSVDGYFNVERKFGVVTLQVTAKHEVVCERVVVGTEEVTITEPDPELVSALPMVTRTEKVEKVVWVCPPNLHELAESA